MEHDWKREFKAIPVQDVNLIKSIHRELNSYGALIHCEVRKHSVEVSPGVRSTTQDFAIIFDDFSKSSSIQHTRMDGLLRRLKREKIAHEDAKVVWMKIEDGHLVLHMPAKE